jgi:hypothetical protein
MTLSSSSQYIYDPDSASITGEWEPRRFNVLEIGIIGFCILSLLGIIVWGFLQQDTKNRDRQREADITGTIIPALEDFYKNSAAVEGSRFYPISRCSGDMNEVDFEFTLRQHLTGQVKEIDPFAYISSDNYPRDNWGTYSESQNQPIPFRCPQNLNLSTISQNNRIYGNFPRCNFSISNNLYKCYLYTTSQNGDRFKVGYYSEELKCFIKYEKFRGQGVTIGQEC